jgi:hypothetical protein
VTFQRIVERSILIGRGTDASPVFLGHRPPYFWIGFQPKKYQSLNDPLGIGKMLRAVIFEGFKHLRVEAVGALDRFGLLGRLRFMISACHSVDCTALSRFERMQEVIRS